MKNEHRFLVDQGVIFENDHLVVQEIHPLINPSTLEGWKNWLSCQEQSKITHERNLRPFYLYLCEQGIRRPTKMDLERYRDSLLKDHSANTVKNYMISLKSFFSFLEEAGLYPDVSRKVKLPRLPEQHLKEPLVPEQIRQLLESCEATEKGKRDKAMIALMACTGLRVNAIRMADIADLRPRQGGVVLQYLQKGYADKNGFYAEIPEALLDLIEDYLISRFKGREWQGSKEPLFTTLSRNRAGERMSERAISGMIKTRMREVGLDDRHYSAHSLRHSFATISHRSGARPEQIQEIMGHRDSRTTHRYIKESSRDENRTIGLVTEKILG